MEYEKAVVVEIENPGGVPVQAGRLYIKFGQKNVKMVLQTNEKNN